MESQDLCHHRHILSIISALIDHFKSVTSRTNAEHISPLINIPQRIKKKVDQTFPVLDPSTYDSDSLPTLLETVPKVVIGKFVSALGHDVDVWCRLDEDAFAVVGNVVLAAEACLEKEQGLFMLMSAIDAFSYDAERNMEEEDLVKHKALVGKHLALPLYFTLVDSSKPSRCRRWAGFLLNALIKDSKENLGILRECPVGWFNYIGKIILESNDRILKAAAGLLIAELLSNFKKNSRTTNIRHFFPAMSSDYCSTFPLDYENEDWHKALLTFIDNLEKAQAMEVSGYNTTNVKVGAALFPSDATLVSVSDDYISIYMPRQKGNHPQWIDIKTCNVEEVDVWSLTSEGGSSLSVVEGKDKLADIQLALVNYRKKEPLFLKSFKPYIGPGRITLTCKDAEIDDIADEIEKARDLARSLSGGTAIRDIALSAPKVEPNVEESQNLLLLKRREEITKMAESPMMNRASAKSGELFSDPSLRLSVAQGINMAPVAKMGNQLKTADQRILEADGNIQTTGDRNVTGHHLAKSSLQARLLNAPQPAAVMDTQSPTETFHTITPMHDLRDANLAQEVKDNSSKLEAREAGLSHHLKVLRRDSLELSKKPVPKLTKIMKVTKAAVKVYESDSEFSELSEPPDDLEVVDPRLVYSPGKKRAHSIITPKFKKPGKLVGILKKPPQLGERGAGTAGGNLSGNPTAKEVQPPGEATVAFMDVECRTNTQIDRQLQNSILKANDILARLGNDGVANDPELSPLQSKLIEFAPSQNVTPGVNKDPSKQPNTNSKRVVTKKDKFTPAIPKKAKMDVKVQTAAVAKAENDIYEFPDDEDEDEVPFMKGKKGRPNLKAKRGGKTTSTSARKSKVCKATLPARKSVTPALPKVTKNNGSKKTPCFSKRSLVVLDDKQVEILEVEAHGGKSAPHNSGEARSIPETKQINASVSYAGGKKKVARPEKPNGTNIDHTPDVYDLPSEEPENPTTSRALKNNITEVNRDMKSQKVGVESTAISVAARAKPALSSIKAHNLKSNASEKANKAVKLLRDKAELVNASELAAKPVKPGKIDASTVECADVVPSRTALLQTKQLVRSAVEVLVKRSTRAAAKAAIAKVKEAQEQELSSDEDGNDFGYDNMGEASVEVERREEEGDERHFKPQLTCNKAQGEGAAKGNDVVVALDTDDVPELLPDDSVVNDITISHEKIVQGVDEEPPATPNEVGVYTDEKFVDLQPACLDIEFYSPNNGTNDELRTGNILAKGDDKVDELNEEPQPQQVITKTASPVQEEGHAAVLKEKSVDILQVTFPKLESKPTRQMRQIYQDALNSDGNEKMSELAGGLASGHGKASNMAPRTPTAALSDKLSRKPQIISWSKEGPMNQGRLLDRTGNSLSVSRPPHALLADPDIAASPSQRVQERNRMAPAGKPPVAISNTQSIKEPVVSAQPLKTAKQSGGTVPIEEQNIEVRELLRLGRDHTSPNLKMAKEKRVITPSEAVHDESKLSAVDIIAAKIVKMLTGNNAETCRKGLVPDPALPPVGATTTIVKDNEGKADFPLEVEFSDVPKVTKSAAQNYQLIEEADTEAKWRHSSHNIHAKGSQEDVGHKPYKPRSETESSYFDVAHSDIENQDPQCAANSSSSGIVSKYWGRRDRDMSQDIGSEDTTDIEGYAAHETKPDVDPDPELATTSLLEPILFRRPRKRKMNSQLEQELPPEPAPKKNQVVRAAKMEDPFEAPRPEQRPSSFTELLMGAKEGKTSTYGQHIIARLEPKIKHTATPPKTQVDRLKATLKSAPVRRVTIKYPINHRIKGLANLAATERLQRLSIPTQGAPLDTTERRLSSAFSAPSKPILKSPRRQSYVPEYDPEKTLLNNSPLAVYSSQTSTIPTTHTSSLYEWQSSETDDRDSLDLTSNVEENAVPVNSRYIKTHQGMFWQDEIPEYLCETMKILEQTSKDILQSLITQKFRADDIVEEFYHSAISKVNTLKRTREEELDKFISKLDGPVRKKVRAEYSAASGRVMEASAVSRFGTDIGKEKGKEKQRSAGGRVKELAEAYGLRQGREKKALEEMLRMCG